jgi:hypothetical protein
MALSIDVPWGRPGLKAIVSEKAAVKVGDGRLRDESTPVPTGNLAIAPSNAAKTMIKTALRCRSMRPGILKPDA